MSRESNLIAEGRRQLAKAGLGATDANLVTWLAAIAIKMADACSPGHMRASPAVVATPKRRAEPIV